MKLSVKCERCRYFSPLPDHNGELQYGECRFNTPAFLSGVAALDGYGYFPIIKTNSWCGKFEREDG